MAIDPELDNKKNRGAKGAWKRTLGRQDVDGNSYLKLFITEAFLHAAAVSDKTMSKEDKQKLVKASYSEHMKHKEWTPIGMLVGLAIFALPVGVGTGIVSNLVAPETEYVQSQIVPASLQQIDGAFTISTSESDNYVLIVQDGRYELYKDDLNGKLYLETQTEAARILELLISEIQSETSDNNIQIGFNYSYRNITEPLIDENEDGDPTGIIMRQYEERIRNYESYNLNSSEALLSTFWQNAQDASGTELYSLSPAELSEIDTDYTFWDGFDDGHTNGMLGIYLLSILSGAAGIASKRVNANPTNGSRRNKKPSAKP